MIKATPGIRYLSLPDSSLARSWSPISPRLSSSIVIAQPNTGLTNAQAKIQIPALSESLCLWIICIPASRSGKNTPTISATR
ncbi:hypothetical protein D049_1553A, partial [Vibrio parahaemolyticus VPTS-2010]